MLLVLMMHYFGKKLNRGFIYISNKEVGATKYVKTNIYAQIEYSPAMSNNFRLLKQEGEDTFRYDLQLGNTRRLY